MFLIKSNINVVEDNQIKKGAPVQSSISERAPYNSLVGFMTDAASAKCSAQEPI